MVLHHVFEVVLEGVIESDRLGRGMESRGPKSKCLEREREWKEKEREREREVGSEIFLCILQPH